MMGRVLAPSVELLEALEGEEEEDYEGEAHQERHEIQGAIPESVIPFQRKISQYFLDTIR